VVCWEQKPGGGGCAGETRVGAGVGMSELGFNMEVGSLVGPEIHL
jgi:hypothetical protein